MKKVISCLLLVTFMALATGCASWQDTTKDSLTLIQKAAESAQKDTVAYFEEKCSEAAVAAAEAGCNETAVETDPKCEAVNKCLKNAEIAEKVYAVLFQQIKLALIAITLGDEQTAISYLAKSLDMMKSVYKTLQTLIPDKIPQIPLLGS